VRIGDRTQTYGEMYARACRLATALAERGVASGDVVATLTENCFETVEIIAATALANLPRATLYSYNTPATNAYLLGVVGARVLIVDATHHSRIAEYLGGLPELELVIVIADHAPARAERYEEVLARGSEDPVLVPADPDDVHIIRFSSGTTGQPKGIFHSIQRWIESSAEYRWVTPMVDETTQYLVPGSIAHVAGSLVWSMLSVGATFHLMAEFDAAQAVRLIEERRITYVALVPVMIKEMLEQLETQPRDMTSLQCIFYAGSPISVETLRTAIARFGNVLYQLYAQSELIPVTMFLPSDQRPDGDEEDQRRLRSAGRATPNVRITIRDESGAVLAAGEVGEVAAQAPGAMSGIWGDEQATRLRLLEDGSVLTGDMGYLDAAGFLYLVDRKNDMIVSGGYNIWPTELEIAIEGLSGVRAVCVVGIPHEKWGETPHAAVVLEDGATLTVEEVVARTREIAGPVKKVTSVEFVDELPRSAGGKVQRGVVRSRFWSSERSRIKGV
jgi:acyl-CoA synthetase (AMP-forming)/AMP-acid ligase II